MALQPPISRSGGKPELKEVPDIVYNSQNKRYYTKGKFLGKGGFARCYELIDMPTNTVYAGKVVSKLLLTKKHQKDKMAQEIEIHRTLSHPHVVKMEGCFEDSENVYILLELCSRRSLMELHKRRKAVTEPEARYFVHQVVLACTYLHDKKIIHRDLKLGNLFLNDQMQLKLGDFGLATVLEYDGERKKTLCGTPNYIAPEMLDKKGHSFEVDIWAIGCILYTLLVGKPPFETDTLKETYNRIKSNSYLIPPRVGHDAQVLIRSLLAPEPSNRPRIAEILRFPFFTSGFLPPALPTSCLTMAPKFNTQAVSGGLVVGKPEIKPKNTDIECIQVVNKPRTPLRTGTLPTLPETQQFNHVRQDAASVLITEIAADSNDVPADFYLAELYGHLTSLVEGLRDKPYCEDLAELEDPASGPIYWISRWVDYSDKYGLGYQLCDNSVGVVFNDNTKVILDAAGNQLQYIERSNTEHFYEAEKYPSALDKKVTLLRFFRNYMNENLMKTGTNIPKRDGDDIARLPCLNTWFRTKSAIVLHLTNGTIQINFFVDHSKLILCPLMGAATYINQNKEVFTTRFALINKLGCPKDLIARLKYAKNMVERLISRNTNSVVNYQKTVSSHIQRTESAASIRPTFFAESNRGGAKN